METRLDAGQTAPKSISPTRRYRGLHRAMAWAAGLALAAWAISGLLHPILAQFGVQQKTMRPPAMSALPSTELRLGRVLAEAGIQEAQAVRLVAGPSAALLQITTSQDQERRYFALPSGRELPGHDRQQAEFLARHYLKADAPVREMRWVGDFNHEYPSVNRLLPVWRVEFDTEDRLTAFVYTETNTLASVTNNTKRTAQTIFQWLHTWSWVPQAGEWGRVVVMAALLLAVLGMAYSGIRLWRGLAGLRKAVRQAAAAAGRAEPRVPLIRRLHKTVGLTLLIPLLAFTASGLFHLLQNANSPPEKNLRLQPAIPMQSLVVAEPQKWQGIATAQGITQASLVQAQGGEVLLRLQSALPAAPAGEHDHHGHASRQARFDGKPQQSAATYLVANTGKLWNGNDRELAIQLAERHLGFGREHFNDITLVTRFGPEYDFRNKRLPVWRIGFAESNPAGLPAQWVFIDTASGVLADRLLAADVPERWSFSLLHKWNFLMPMIGREGVNIATGVAAAMIAGLAAVGLRLRSRRGQARKLG